MEQEAIRTGLSDLQPSELYDIERHIFLEVRDGGADLKITRHPVPGIAGYEFIGLSVSGESAERERVIAEFVSFIGDPVHYEMETGSQPIEYVLWICPGQRI